VAARQIDNELRGSECRCPACRHAFQVWLLRKYGSVEKLNEAWGTVFWSQHYNSMGLYPELNLYDLSRELDVMAWDAYPHVDEDFVSMARAHDMIRATRHDNFWMLEQKNGYFNGSDNNLAITPGLARAGTGTLRGDR